MRLQNSTPFVPRMPRRFGAEAVLRVTCLWGLEATDQPCGTLVALTGWGSRGANALDREETDGPRASTEVALWPAPTRTDHGRIRTTHNADRGRLHSGLRAAGHEHPKLYQ